MFREMYKFTVDKLILLCMFVQIKRSTAHDLNFVETFV